MCIQEQSGWLRVMSDVFVGILQTCLSVHSAEWRIRHGEVTHYVHQ